MNYEHDDYAMREAALQLQKKYGGSVFVERQTKVRIFEASPVRVDELRHYWIHLTSRDVAVNNCDRLEGAIAAVQKAADGDSLLERAAKLEAEAAKLRELAKEPEPTAQEAACSI